MQLARGGRISVIHRPVRPAHDDVAQTDCKWSKPAIGATLSWRTRTTPTKWQGRPAKPGATEFFSAPRSISARHPLMMDLAMPAESFAQALPQSRPRLRSGSG